MQELDELKALKSLFSELEKGEVSGREQGYVSIEESRRMMGV